MLHAGRSDLGWDARAARERFDPPLRRHDWTTDVALPVADFLEEARARSGWDAPTWQRVLHHGGLHLGRRPCSEASLPANVPAGTRIIAWAFLWEPEPVHVSERDVLFDEGGLLAVNKPAWITMQGSRASQRLSLEAGLRALTGCASLTAVHRLDRETSGVALFARDAHAAAWLGEKLRRGALRRRYLAWVSPAPDAQSWEVRGFLARELHPRRFFFVLHASAGSGRRASHTCFTRLASDAERALVRAEPTTGRTHQIRVHLAASGAPILGDVLYAGAPKDDSDCAAGRLQLHAAAVRVPLAQGARGREVEIRAPLPSDFASPPGGVAPESCF